MLDARKINVKTTRKAKAEPLADADVRNLLKEVDTVLIVKGKKIRTEASRDVSLADLRGPTGNFRAPMLRLGRRLLVGFNEDALLGELGAR